MDGLFFETSRFELPARGPRGLFGLSPDSRPGTWRCAVLLAPNHRRLCLCLGPTPTSGSGQGRCNGSPCSVERRLLTGNLKWLHWLVVIRFLILPVGLLTSFKVPSRIGGILRPRRALSSKALAFPVALAALAALVAFPKRHVSLSWSGFHGPSPKSKSWDGAGRGCLPFNGPSPTDRQPPPSPPSGQ